MLCLWTILKELCRTQRSWYEELRQCLFDLSFTVFVMHLQSGCLLVFIAVSCVYVYMYHKAIMIKFVLESVLRLTFILYLMCLSGFSFFSSCLHYTQCSSFNFVELSLLYHTVKLFTAWVRLS